MKTKLLALLILSLSVIPLFSMPASAVPDGDVIVSVGLATLPASQVTATSATLNGTISITFELEERARSQRQPEFINPFVFDYGKAPGVYTNTVAAQFISGQVTETSITGVFRATITHLTPCDRYFARFRSSTSTIIIFLDNTSYSQQSVGNPLVGNEVTFKTTGCSSSTGPSAIGTGPGSGGGGGGGGGLPPFQPTPTGLSNIVVQSATVSSTKVSPGEKIDVAATITNKGGSNGASKITLYVNGQEAESTGITLASGESTPVHFYVSRNEPGTYSVYVGGASAGSFVVDNITNNDILIYSLIALFTLGIGGILYLVTRRQRA